MMQPIILFDIPHVRIIRAESGVYCLIAEDTAVNDYVEDFLWDHFQYDTTSVSVSTKTGPVIYQNCFSRNLIPGDLLDAIKGLDVEEVKRIYARNHDIYTN